MVISITISKGVPNNSSNVLVQSQYQAIELLSGGGGLCDDLRRELVARLLDIFGSRGILRSIDGGVRRRSRLLCGRHCDVCFVYTKMID